MAFPDDPRDLSTWFAFGYSQFDNPLTATFEQVSPGATADDPGPVLGQIRIERGRIGSAPETAPTKITFALRNVDGEFSPRNVSGPRYGTLREGTPCRVRVDTGSGWVSLATANVTGFEPVSDGPGVNPRVPITALGLLNRISRDTDVMSVARRSISALNAFGPSILSAYWPMEDGAGNGLIASGLGDAAGTVTDATYAVDVDLASSLPLLEFAATTALNAAASRTATFASAWSTTYVQRWPQAPSVETTLADVAVTGSTLARVVVKADASSITATAYDSAGASIGTASLITVESAHATLFSGDWVVVSVWADSGNDDFGMHVATAGGATVATVSGSVTLSGSHGSPMVFAVPQSAMNAGMAMGHLTFDTGSLFATWYADLLGGYAGEQAAERVDRLLFEAGIPRNVPSTTHSSLMAPQPAGSLPTLVRAAEDVDGGVLHEQRLGPVTFQATEVRYNATAALELDFTADVADLLTGPTDRTRYNIIRVSDATGNFAVAEETDGPVGSDTTTGIGPRPYSATRDAYTAEDLALHAGWLLRKGTTDKPPYIVVLDLRGNPDMVAPYMAAATSPNDIIGARITLTGAPSEDHGPDPLDLIVEGEVMELGADVWRVQLYCEPYEPWRVQQWADAPPSTSDLDGWWGPTSFTVDADFDAGTDTSMDVAVDPAITTNANQMPMRIRAAGVLLEVTAVGAASGGVQTLAVTQAPLNGAEKTIPAGTPVELADPLIWSL